VLYVQAIVLVAQCGLFQTLLPDSREY